MTKFLLGIAIIAFTTFCGYLLAKKYRQRKLFFQQLREFNERFLCEVSYYKRPVKEFAVRYAYRGEFNLLLHNFLHNLDTDNEHNNFLNEAQFSFLKTEDRRMVADYFLMLGRGDSSSQKSYFTSVKNELISLQKDADTACKKYGDLYVKLGFLCGLLFLILII